MPLDRRYSIVASAFVIQAVMVGGLFAYGVFFSFLEAELGWSRTLLSACVSLSFIVMGLCAMGAGQLNDRLGPRGIMCVAGLAYGLGYALMYYLSAPWQLFVLFGVLIGLGLGTHDVVTLSVVARRFAARRGVMTAVVKVGTACGQIVIPLIATALIAGFGWRAACVALGMGAALVLIAASFGLGRGPSRAGAPTPGSGPEAARQGGPGLRDAARSRSFWTLCFAQFAFLPSLVTVPVHIPVHGIDIGMSPASAATLLSLIGATSIAGRLFVGGAADRLGGRIAMMLCLIVLSSSLVYLTLVDEPWMLFVFAGVYGFAHGGLLTVVSPTVAEYFSLRAHGAIFGVVLFSGTLGASVGPLAAGQVFDTTGSYQLAFWGLAGLAFAGLLLIGSLPRSAPR